MVLLEVGSAFDGFFESVILVMLGPPVLLTVIGFIVTNRKLAKVLFILAGLYLVVGLGICGALLSY